MKLRRNIQNAVSRVWGEPTDSALYGAFIEPSTLKAIETTHISTWVRKRPDDSDAEVDESSYPAAWAAGRELARQRYAERLRDFVPIPREPAEIVHVALGEMNALQVALMTSISFLVKKGELTQEDVDINAIKACCTSHALTLREIFASHWE